MTNVILEDYVQYVFDFWEKSPTKAPQKRCFACGRDLPETSEFWHRVDNRFRQPCKSCRHDDYLAHSKEIIQQHRESFLAKPPQEQEQIRDRWNKQYHERSLKRRREGMCSKCLALPAVPGLLICDRCLAYQKQYGDELRKQVFAVYGGKCILCGETRPEFLSVDHIDNDGAKHRRVTGGGHRLYMWLRNHGFPQEGFQLLCANCNWLKHVNRKPVEKTYIMLWRAILRQETLAAYGGKCVCCGEDRPEVLTIDHMNNNGALHRRQVGAGSAFYAWLRKNGFPKEGFQVLCFNCNRSRYYHGVCPHQR